MLSVLCRQHLSSGWHLSQSKGLVWAFAVAGLWVGFNVELWLLAGAGGTSLETAPCPGACACLCTAPSPATSALEGPEWHPSSCWAFLGRVMPLVELLWVVTAPKELAGLTACRAPTPWARLLLPHCYCGAPLNALGRLHLRCKCGLFKNSFVCGPLNKDGQENTWWGFCVLVLLSSCSCVNFPGSACGTVTRKWAWVK